MTAEPVSREVRTLPHVVEDLAKTDGDSTWAYAPKDVELATGWREITYQELAHAVDGAARWIDQHVKADGEQKMIAYMGVNDMRYATVELGLMKTGHMTMLPSLRNSREGQMGLFDRTGCKVLLCSEGVHPAVELISTAIPDLQVLQVPSFDVLRDLGARNVPYERHYDETEDAHVLVLHTSGSTGTPKPIYISHGGIEAAVANFTEIVSPPGRLSLSDVYLKPGKPNLCLGPFFHEMGHTSTVNSILVKQPLLLLPVGRPVNAGLVKEVIDQMVPSTGIFPPSVLEQILELPGGLDTLSKMESVIYGGGPLNRDVGDQIRQVALLITAMGSTEAGVIHHFLPTDPQDWQYYEWDPVSGVDMQPEADGLYELVIKPKNRRYQKVFHTFPTIKEWRTNDLYKQHPSKPGSWCHVGRKDDVLVLSNGEKVQPLDFESRLIGHPLVNGALAIGQGRFQTGLLIEPQWESLRPGDGTEELLDAIWPTIVEGNKALPEHGRVWRSKVAFSRRDKPFVRAGKGTVIRRQTTNLYEAELNALYANEADDDQIEKLPADADLSATKSFLRKVIKVKGIAIPDDFPEDADFFSTGVDSLQVLALISTLNHTLSTGQIISASAVYSHPTISALAEFLQGTGQQEANGVKSKREDVIATMIDKYTSDLPSHISNRPTARPQKHGVVLTGSTGALGNCILQSLIATDTVGAIFCLNRSEDAEHRQHQSFTDRNVEADFSKVSFFQSDFSKDHFGLASDVYERMLDSVDIFIHNAWAVDFNKALSSYEQVHIAGTRRCVDFSLASKYRAHIVFISSIASVSNWSQSHPGSEDVPERLIEDHSLPGRGGYGESKHVASFILAAAAKAGVPSTIVRSGQIAGASVGGNEWNRHEWFPSIVLSSKVMGVLPDRLGNMSTVDWVPVDLQAQAVVEIAETWPEGTETLRMTHLVNPRTSSWADLLPEVKDQLSRDANGKIEIVGWEEWVRTLKAVPATRENAESIPGIKLAEFYDGMSVSKPLTHKTQETAKLSQTVANMQPVSSKLMGHWMEQWLGMPKSK